MNQIGNEKFYGTATVGEKGQVVIPAQARKAMKTKKGEKMLVFRLGADIIVLSKISNLEKFASHLTEKLKVMKEIIKKNNS